LDPDKVVSILATTLYIIENEKLSTRRAFREACRIHKCRFQLTMREELYELVRSFISRYYTLKYIVLSSGRRPSYRLLARLFLYIYHNEGGLNPRSIVKKTSLSNLPEVIESLEFAELHVKYSLPEWFYKRLALLLPRSDLVNLLSSMDKRVLWLRINTLKVDVDKALKNLEKWARVEVDPDIPYLVKVLASKRPIRSLDLVKNGEVIPQDKASVLAVEALKPDPGSVVYDFAAAPGIKSSLIMQLTENKARIVAIDNSPRRLWKTTYLLKHYGVDLSRVEIVLGDSGYINLRGRGDYGLIDAPCSSSGSISKDPAIKIFLRDMSLVYKMKQLQLGILYNALKHVENAVYTTCSLLPEEGEEVVNEVLDMGVEHHPVEPSIRASTGYSIYRYWDRVKRTFPHIHECEGFFISRLER